MGRPRKAQQPPAPVSELPAEQPSAPSPVAAAVFTTPHPPPAPFTHELPRLLHKPGGDYKRVDTQGECEQAMRDGWTLRPEA